LVTVFREVEDATPPNVTNREWECDLTTRIDGSAKFYRLKQ